MAFKPSDALRDHLGFSNTDTMDEKWVIFNLIFIGILVTCLLFACINLLGGDLEYASIPWFLSDQYELKLQMVGFSSDGEESIVRGDKSTNSFAVFHLKEGRVVAVDAVNNSKAFMLGKRLYGKSVDASGLADEAGELTLRLQSIHRDLTTQTETESISLFKKK